MSWGLLAFGVPAISFCKVLAMNAPSAYREFDQLPKSGRTEAVWAIVERVLRHENVRGAQHFDRIQRMLKNLPGEKNISALARHRFRVVDVEEDDFPASSTGTDADDGKYFIGLSPRLEGRELPWVIAHEMAHILGEDPMKIGVAKAVASFAAAAFAVGVFDCSWLTAAGCALLANGLVQAAGSQVAERAADDFAIRHSSREQLASGAVLLERVKQMREEGQYSQDWGFWLFYPSEEERIAKIREGKG